MTILHPIITDACYFLVVVVAVVQCSSHNNFNDPFGKHHSMKTFPSPYGCNRSLGISFPSISLPIIYSTELNVSSTFYISNEQVMVTWPATYSSCDDDFIGIYFIDIPLLIGACDYFDYEFIQTNQTIMSWQMINLHRPLEFRYYSRDKNCSGNYSLMAKSAIVQSFNYNAPEQIHLAYGDQIDHMFVSYVTNSSEYVSECQYELGPSSLQRRVQGTTITYKASDMCNGQANIPGPKSFIDPGFIHTIIFEDIRPATTYFYRVGNEQHGWSSVLSFTNRPADDYNAKVLLIAYGDMGVAPTQPGAKSTVDRVQAQVLTNNITCILHIGDISYARGIGALWDALMTQIDLIASHVPYMVGI
ncbi:unnamed protein product [Rotaria socialis]|uniref:Purple acid phosphatase N-terminal domain-containing protein n=1 Tax=Rotaria socialis TaxID=392032 RepID=A0A818RL04_9BILA|nr:unnamed protein product [Rotaria socialis]CAF3319349.1 unnamed protein product [Rotaria socialis]CAF3374066.1 unnamed protein product [Rotaria socialis]CAF3659457.1 unnamed protein product [Rotaria socialis]